MKFARIGWFLNFVLSLLFFNASHAQVTLSGKVFDENTKEPLIGASVVIDGTTEGTVTDFDGAFALKTQSSLPVKLSVSYVGYEPKIVDVASDEELDIFLGESVITTDVVEVRGQRISDKQKSSPLTVESMDVLAIKETAATSFYEGLGNLKGVDLTAASLGFKVINTRGFNSTSPVRSLQLIDGVDNQSPGLNFSLGNFLGASELDVLKVDLVQGASSAFYGPGAFNGVISMTTKGPFYHKGLSAMVKAGERNLVESAFRWADAVKNKDGQDVFGYKINFSYLRADDWEADNFSPVDNSIVDASNPGRFDAVNIYGDEFFAGNNLSGALPWNFVGLGTWYRTGYREVDLVDYDTENIKANVAFHLRTNPSKGIESPELIYASSFSTGTTVYQGDNRFSLRDILFFQNRLEFRKQNKFFIRAYATHEDAGNSYDPYFTALRLQERAKTNQQWSADYVGAWRGRNELGINFENRARQLGYPELEIVINPDGSISTMFDNEAANQWIMEFQDSLTAWHSFAEQIANLENPISTEPSQDFLRPGTPEFQQAFDEITSGKNNEEENGTRFFDRSALYHVHGEYRFTPEFVDEIVVGGNYRLYTPDSDGTIFYDTADVTITNSEFGLYAGVSQKYFDERLTLSGTLRMDKNENFDAVVSPALSMVWKPKPNNYLRASFSSALRNPTLADQFLNLNVGRAILAGNLNGVDSLITIESFDRYRDSLDLNQLEYIDIDPVRPEQVRTFELGYRTTLFNKLYVDAGYYYSVYTSFLGFNIGVEATFDEATGFPTDLQAYRYAANSRNNVTTQGFSIGLNYYFGDYYQLSGNYSWNRLNSDIDDPIIPAFNTPEHKFNIGFSGRNIVMDLGGLTLKNWGFNINYKWIEGFIFEGSPQFTGFIPSYDLLDAQINYHARSINTTFKLGASNVLNNLVFQTYGGPRVGRLAYFSLLYEWKKK
ncbi:TonB-dependent receptor [Phaeodactylibacter sp.]|uniref:TonB-dependent receptor domain-containing protein n=1 Tax=Phaeodactylibacter sp. TaxID=1940289 RepID=UPI0025D5DBA2|nr:TonB-dependent receptor [Phaeodactylibacter sp.]MCI5090715.1 TonB-dependent receptor [Phaeodactylibacter sp.]